MVSNLMALN